MRKRGKWFWASLAFGALFVVFAVMTMVLREMWFFPVACLFQVAMMLSASREERGRWMWQ